MRPVGKLDESAALVRPAVAVAKTVATKVAVDKGTEAGKAGVDAAAAKLKARRQERLARAPRISNDREVN